MYRRTRRDSVGAVVTLYESNVVVSTSWSKPNLRFSQVVAAPTNQQGATATAASIATTTTTTTTTTSAAVAATSKSMTGRQLEGRRL